MKSPGVDLVLEVRKEDEDTDFTSKAFQEKRKRKRGQAVAKLKPAPIFLAVHRMDSSVYFRRIEPEEFAILSALRAGKPLGKAVGAGLRKTAIPLEQRGPSVQQWFQNWAALGWLCQP